jgi:hypothetical protein
LKDVNELPSMEEFEKLVAESFQSDLLPLQEGVADATGVPDSEASEVSNDDEEISSDSQQSQLAGQSEQDHELMANDVPAKGSGDSTT